jgi:hypothetical protein
MTPQQNDVLLAAVDLINGGMDTEEVLGCYRVIAQYVVKTVPPDSVENKDNLLKPLPDLERQEIMWRVAVTSALETGEAPYVLFADRIHSYLVGKNLMDFKEEPSNQEH